jgi:hypothetical protein
MTRGEHEADTIQPSVKPTTAGDIDRVTTPRTWIEVAAGTDYLLTGNSGFTDEELPPGQYRVGGDRDRFGLEGYVEAVSHTGIRTTLTLNSGSGEFTVELDSSTGVKADGNGEIGIDDINTFQVTHDLAAIVDNAGSIDDVHYDVKIVDGDLIVTVRIGEPAAEPCGTRLFKVSVREIVGAQE